MKTMSSLDDVRFPVPDATNEDSAMNEGLTDALNTCFSTDCLCPITNEEHHPEETARITMSSGPKVVMMFFILKDPHMGHRNTIKVPLKCSALLCV